MKNRHTSFEDLQGKTYLVTGASSGIGAATALALGYAGANVVLAARRIEACEEVAKQIRTAGGQALVLDLDVRVEETVRQTVEKAVGHFGRLDGAFNNAGVLGVSRPLHEIATEEMESVLRTNIMGVFWSMKYEIASMLSSGGGAIVNNASIAASVAFPGISPYNTSKHGVLGITRTAALEYFKQGIRINAVCPGPVETPMAELAFGGKEHLKAAMAGSPGGRAGRPDEIARPVLFLLSGMSSYLSGQGLTIDGGFTVQ